MAISAAQRGVAASESNPAYLPISTRPAPATPKLPTWLSRMISSRRSRGRAAK